MIFLLKIILHKNILHIYEKLFTFGIVIPSTRKTTFLTIKTVQKLIQHTTIFGNKIKTKYFGLRFYRRICHITVLPVNDNLQGYDSKSERKKISKEKILWLNFFPGKTLHLFYVF